MRTRPLLYPLAAGLGVVAWGALIEVRAFTLRHVTVPVLPAGADPLRVLHLSDAHMRPGQGRKQDWLRGLARLKPDLVVNTGDNLAHLDALPSVLDAYGDLLDVPGVFVLGSNDYFSPTGRNPVTYLRGGSGVESAGAISREPDLPFAEMKAAFTSRGWLDLTNRPGQLSVGGLRLGFSGVDDPHLVYDDLGSIPPAPAVDLAMGVAHAPYLRVLDQFTALGYPLILAGHTHGGQLCLPGFGALVTNCDLDRQRAKGLHHHAVPGAEPSWLHVSAGLGTSPYAPLRIACRPEATLLTLTEIDSLRFASAD